MREIGRNVRDVYQKENILCGPQTLFLQKFIKLILLSVLLI